MQGSLASGEKEFSAPGVTVGVGHSQGAVVMCVRTHILVEQVRQKGGMQYIFVQKGRRGGSEGGRGEGGGEGVLNEERLRWARSCWAHSDGNNSPSQ